MSRGFVKVDSMGLDNRKNLVLTPGQNYLRKAVKMSKPGLVCLWSPIQI